MLALKKTKIGLVKDIAELREAIHIKAQEPKYSESDITNARQNFFAYRKFMRGKDFLTNWFVEDLAKQLESFYIDYILGLRPILLIQSPPQHGKSTAVIDFISWITGHNNALRVIFGSYSDLLGVRANTNLQRIYDSSKFKAVFPDTCISRNNVIAISDKAKRNSKQIEYINAKGEYSGGQFRNTTVAGAITGETLDIGVIDDPVKGREQANSLTLSEKIWDWFTDDFSTRSSDIAGLIVVMTRWATHDVIARLEKKKDIFKTGNFKVVNYPALATQDEQYRKEDQPLFPELKSKSFLLSKKSLLTQANWEALYQGNPTIQGGNLFKDHHWQWWTKLPPLKYKLITADTAMKTKTYNDYSVLQCWGYGINDKLYLLDKLRGKWQAYDLQKEAEVFYKKHDTKREKVGDPALRGMWIEDKASGIGLEQNFRRMNMKVHKVPRHTDKIFRAEEVEPLVRAGLVYLNTNIDDIGNLTKEAREFPNSTHDDDIDTLMTAVEITYINKAVNSSLLAAMEA